MQAARGRKGAGLRGALVALMVACTTTVAPGGAEPAVTASEGSRLTPLAWVPEDGTTVVARGQFFDSELDHPCSVSLDEAGGRRCFPGDYRLEPAHWFTTDDCTEMAVPASACAERPAFVREALTRDDGTLFLRAYRATDRTLDLSAAAYTRARTPLFSTECVPYEGDPSPLLAPGQELVAAERIPDGELVGEQSTEVGSLGGGLEQYEVVMGDGSRFRTRDPETPCRVYATSSAGPRCLPATDVQPRSRSLFSDASCTERVWAVPLIDLGGGDALVLTGDDARPPVIESAQRVTGEPELRPVFRRDDRGECRAEGEEVVASLSAPIPLEDFPALTREPRGGGRLRPLVYADPQGREWPVVAAPGSDPFPWLTSRYFAVFRDTALGIDCGAAPSVEGERCFPRGTMVYYAPFSLTHQFFLDEGCDDPLLQPTFLGEPVLTHVARIETVGEGCNARQAVVELRRVEAVSEGTPLWFRPRGGECAPSEPAGEDSGAFRAAGEPLDLTRYARFVRTPNTP